MLIVGAQGMAKEVLEILSLEKNIPDEKIVFFDNKNKDLPKKLFDRFEIINDLNMASEYFTSKSEEFILGLGNPSLRENMALEFSRRGGKLISVISSSAKVGSFNTSIGIGSIIMPGVIISNEVHIGKGVLINYNSTISHETHIGDYVEIACGVNIPGRCRIENKVFIGTNAVLNPDITIGENSVVGSGAVVTKNVPSNCIVAGNPAKVLNRNA